MAAKGKYPDEFADVDEYAVPPGCPPLGLKNAAVPTNPENPREAESPAPTERLRPGEPKIEEATPPGVEAKHLEDEFAEMTLGELLSDTRWEAKVFGMKRLDYQKCDFDLLEKTLALLKDRSVPVQKECLEVVNKICQQYSDRERLKPVINEWWSSSLSQYVLSGQLNQPKTKTALLEALENVLPLVDSATSTEALLAGLAKFTDLKNGATVLNSKTFKGVAIKTACSTFAVVEKILELFGTQYINVQTLLPLTSAFITSTDRTLREQVYGLCVMLYRYFKSTQIFMATVSQKPILAEIEKRCKAFEADPPLQPAAQSKAAAAPPADVIVADTAQDRSENFATPAREFPPEHLTLDTWKMLPGVDLLGSDVFAADQFERKYHELVKWNEKKEYLEKFIEPITVCPKVNMVAGSTSNLKHVVSTMMTIMNHEVNVNVQCVSVKVVTTLVQAIRGSFPTDTCRSVCKHLLIKLKDKSKPLQMNITDCLDTILAHTDCKLDMIMEDASHYVLESSKNPQQRLLILQWLSKAMTKADEAVMDKSIKRLVNIAVECIADQQSSTRAAAGIILLHCAEVNDRVVSQAINVVKDPKKKTTIKEVLARTGKESPLSQPTPAITNPPPVRSSTLQNRRQSVASAAFSPAAGSTSAMYANPNVMAVLLEMAQITTLDYPLGMTQILDLVRERLTAARVPPDEIDDVLADVSDPASPWKSKLTSYEMILEHCQKGEALSADLIGSLIFLAGPNINGPTATCVKKELDNVTELLNVCCSLQENRRVQLNGATRLPTNSALHPTVGLFILRKYLPKLNDAKFEKEVKTLLTRVCELVGPVVGFLALKSVFTVEKLTVKAQGELASSASDLLTEFSPALMDAELTKECMKEVSKTIRNPRLQHTISVALQSKFSGGETARHAERTIRGYSMQADRRRSSAVEPTESDFESLVSRALIDDINSTDLKARKAALTRLLEVLKENVEHEPCERHVELALGLKKSLKNDQRGTQWQLVEAIAVFPMAVAYSDVFIECAKHLLPQLIQRMDQKLSSVANVVMQGCLDWLTKLGPVDFMYFGGMTTEAGTNSPIGKLSVDKKEWLYGMLADSFKAGGSRFAVDTHRALCGAEFVALDATLDRSPNIKRLCCELLLSFELGRMEDWEDLWNMLMARKSVSLLPEVEEIIAEKMTVTDVYKMMKLLPYSEVVKSVEEMEDPPAVASRQRIERCNRAKWSPVAWTSIDDIRRYAELWRPHISEQLWCAMFPEINSAEHDVGHALEFWSYLIDMGSKCTCVENRLGASETYVRLFDETEGVFDLLCQWLLWRVTDATMMVRTASARLLQDTVAKLIAARVDIRTLQDQGLGDMLTPEMRLEGTIAIPLIELLLDTFLEILPLRAESERRVNDEDDVYSTVKDVFLALTFVTPDTCTLYAMAFVRYKRYPDVLELTAFIIEQEGWKASSHLMHELIDYAQIALSETWDSNARDLAAQCLVLLLLSLDRKAASIAVQNLEESIPGTRKFVSKYTRSHQSLLSVFPRGGIPGGDEKCFEEKSTDAHSLLSHVAKAGPAKPPALAQQTTTASNEEEEQAADGPTDSFKLNSLDELDRYMEELGLDSSVDVCRDELEKKSWELKKQHSCIRLLDWFYEIRREREGKQVGTEEELIYWNGVKLLEHATKPRHGPDCAMMSYIILECKRLLQQDMTQVSEASSVLLKIHEEYGGSSSEWMLPYSTDLICGCYNALKNVFNMEKINLPGFIKTAQLVVDLTFEVCKDRKVLHQASPGLLCNIFGAVLLCMGCHKYWYEIPGSQKLVEKLNNIMGLYLLGLVSPRTASCILECFYDYSILPLLATNGAQSKIIDADLFSRVSKRFIKKLNMKHPQVTQIDPDSLYPLSSTDRLNYLRTIDSLMGCILTVEVCLAAPTTHNELRQALLDCARETFASLLIYTPALVGIYLRDKGYSSCYEELEGKLQHHAEQMGNGDLLGNSAGPLVIEPSMTRSRFASYVLERLMNEKVTDDLTYLYLHKGYLASGQNVAKLTLPDVFPRFRIDEIVERAPQTISLSSLDPTTSGAWAAKRDKFYSGERKINDVVSLDELRESWSHRMPRLIDLGRVDRVLVQRTDHPVPSAEKLTSLAMRFRAFCKSL